MQSIILQARMTSRSLGATLLACSTWQQKTQIKGSFSHAGILHQVSNICTAVFIYLLSWQFKLLMSNIQVLRNTLSKASVPRLCCQPAGLEAGAASRPWADIIERCNCWGNRDGARERLFYPVRASLKFYLMHDLIYGSFFLTADVFASTLPCPPHL